jgi:hypothetical protein
VTGLPVVQSFTKPASGIKQLKPWPPPNRHACSSSPSLMTWGLCHAMPPLRTPGRSDQPLRLTHALPALLLQALNHIQPPTKGQRARAGATALRHTWPAEGVCRSLCRLFFFFELSHSTPTPSSLLYETPCRLQALLADYIACNEEPLQSTEESNARGAEISLDFLALRSSGLRLRELLREGTGTALEGRSSAPRRIAMHLTQDEADRASGSGSDSDLSEPDPPVSQVRSQKQVQKMGGNAGGLWT